MTWRSKTEIDGDFAHRVRARFEASNLYVAGSAGFTTSGAAHPTLLIAALSHRLADHLAQRLRSLLQPASEAA